MGRFVNCAVMTLLEFIATGSGLIVPLASPLQPRNCCPASGTAVSVTLAPLLKRLPRGLFVTMPKPSASTVSAYCPALNGAKAADTVALAFVTTKFNGLFVPLPALPHKAK